jgi:3-hydroxybutyrate dehydrogenase/3-oxoacyl-[acyl-carrier protein] reductase
METDIMKSAGPEAAAAQGMSYEEFLNVYAQQPSIKRLNTVTEVAALAVFIASEMGGGINGALLDIHGGSLLA